MKKLLLSVLLFLVPFAVSASTCKVVSGDGTNIGDEISCSGENFYILSNDGTDVTMLAKYNLYVGDEIIKIEFDEPITYYYTSYYTEKVYINSYTYWMKGANSYYTYNDITYSSSSDILQSLIEEAGYTYDDIIGTGINSYSSDCDLDNYCTFTTYELSYVLILKSLTYNDVLQNSVAIGAHGDVSGEPEYPEVGIVNGFYFYDYYDYDSAFSTGTVYAGGYLDLNLDYEYNTIVYYLEEYEDSLTNLGLEIDDISILAVSDINEIVYSETGKYLPLYDWWYNWELIDGTYNTYKVGSIKDYLSDDYSWLWSTTYWTKTVAGNTYPEYMYIYFVDTLGDLCSDYACVTSAGAGIRPVVTMSSNNIVYNITTKTDGNGTIEVSSETAYYSDLVTFTITANSGYTLSTLTLTASDGTSVTYELSDETYTFTVSQDTVIEATFSEIVEDVVEVDTTTTEQITEEVEETNPNTGSFIPLVLIPMAVIGIAFINKKQILKKI